MVKRPIFDRLFQAGRIGTLELKNRIIMPPMGTCFPTIWGEATETSIDYFNARARGGAALIFIESAHTATAIDPIRQLCRSLRIDDDGFGPGLAAVVESVHEAGARIGIQLIPGMSSQARGGPWAVGQQHIQEVLAVGPSGVIHPEVKTPARALTVAEIEKIVELFGWAAARAKAVGFDIIEIHAHSGFLTGQFLSPYFNRRTDKYGGTPERRQRFLLELIESTRRKVGARFPVTVKFSVAEFFKGGRDLKEGQAIARAVQEADIDGITVSSGIHGAEIPSMPSMYHGDGVFIPLAEALKEVVSIPLILPGKLGDPYLAEKVLEEGKADFIGWGRPLIADPDLPRKAAEGRIDEIRKCLYCNECVYVQWANKYPLRCTVNPVAGREGRFNSIRRAESRKRVVVIGAGPAGMEAARVAALRGHDVVLYEKSRELGGGQLRLASVPPHKDVLKSIVDYHAACFKGLPNLKVVLGKEVTAEEVIAGGADAVVVATGAEALVPDIPGAKGKNVVTAHDIVSGRKVAGQAGIVAGGGSVGCEVANVLANLGKKVTVVEMLDAVVTDVHGTVRDGLLGELGKSGVKILTGVRINAITGDGVNGTDAASHPVTLKADAVVLALGAKSRNEIAAQLAGKVSELYVIGDAKQPRRIREAISEGYMVAFGI